MSLAAHLVETYEDKPLSSLHPPQNVQHPPGYRPQIPISRNMQNQAGPSNYQYGQSGGGGEWSNHGMPWWMAIPPHMMQSQHSFTPWSEEKVAQLQVRLARKLGPEYVTQRPGPGGGPKLSYIEGWKVINLANEVFGFNGWSSSIVSLVTDFIDVNDQGRCSVSVSAQVRITLKDGAYHEDIGCGQGENVRGKASALDKAKKEAVTDATKRALRNFGNILGNCLYDKNFTANVMKMKVPPPKWNPDELERRPEFTPAGGIKAPAPAPNPAPPPITNAMAAPPVPYDPPRAGTPLRSVDESMVDTTLATLDENFDAEFLDDSFLDVDMSAVGEISAQSRQTTHVPSTSSRPGQPAGQPAYQHRHRPDPPPAPAYNAASRSNTTSDQGGGSGLSRSAEEVKQNDGHPRSSGSSGTAVEANQRGKPGGQGTGNGASDRPTTNAGSSARAQAILAASRSANSAPTFSRSTTTPNLAFQTPHAPRPPPPIRAESPRIPDGGIDAVAAKAASAMNFRMSAQKLELDLTEEGGGGGGGMTYGGFASARGMKRVISGEERHTSPTKQGGAVQRNGPRRALGEIEVPGQEWDGAKRPRAM